MSGTITPAGMTEAATVARDDMLVGDFGWVSPTTPGATKRGRVSTLFGAMTSADVTAALGYAPANGAVTLTSFNSRTGAVTLTIGDITAIVASLPTTLPAGSGTLWLNGGVLQLS